MNYVNAPKNTFWKESVPKTQFLYPNDTKSVKLNYHLHVQVVYQSSTK